MAIKGSPFRGGNGAGNGYDPYGAQVRTYKKLVRREQEGKQMGRKDSMYDGSAEQERTTK
jgi:hypothetical protein